MVRPILEYGNAARIHQYAGDADKVERVQRRATKLCPTLRDLPYEDRLAAMRLPSMHYRQERGDMIQTYKILTGRDRVDQNRILPLSSNDKARRHTYKLNNTHSRLNIRQCPFGPRVVSNWNSLPQWIVDAHDTNDFKGKLDKFWSHRQYETRLTHDEGLA